MHVLLGNIIFTHTVQFGGQAPCFYFFRRGHFAFNQNHNFLFKKQLISLMTLTDV
jgi:hypothetical protein